MGTIAIDPIWWVVVGLLLALVAVGISLARRRAARTARLKGRFKSEYDRTAASAGGRRRAERELEERLVRRAEMDLTAFDTSDAEGLHHHVDELARSFVDGPRDAARGMADLVARISVARGYAANEQGVLDLVSVDHPEPVSVLRRALADMEASSGAGLTEASRVAFLEARVLAERLLAEARAGQLEPDQNDRSTVASSDVPDGPRSRVREPDPHPGDRDVGGRRDP